MDEQDAHEQDIESHGHAWARTPAKVCSGIIIPTYQGKSSIANGFPKLTTLMK
jgi:hypothetical protein